MTAFGSAKALVYYEDTFAVADCGKLLSGEVGRPTAGRRIGTPPTGWRDLAELIRDFLRCWLGSMGWPPLVNASLLAFILHGSSQVELDNLEAIATNELGDRYERVDPNNWIARDRGPSEPGNE
jgi:hypothetical protein